MLSKLTLSYMHKIFSFLFNKDFYFSVCLDLVLSLVKRLQVSKGVDNTGVISYASSTYLSIAKGGDTITQVSKDVDNTGIISYASSTYLSLAKRGDVIIQVSKGVDNTDVVS